MDNAAHLRHEILEAIECCRAHSGDLNDPQFAELAASLAEDPELRVHFERVQKADAAIKAAMADGPLPADLAAHVLHRLADAAAAKPIEPVPAAAGSPLPRPTAAPRLFSRRRVVSALAALAASAAVFAVVLFRQQPAPIAKDDVLANSREFFERDVAAPGQLVSEVAPPAGFPYSRDLRQGPTIRWRRVGKFLGDEAVAYDLPADGGRATLYVVRRSAADLPSSPPGRPDLSTAGVSVAAWNSGGLVYVLVLSGEEHSYDNYLDRGPLT